MNNNLYLCNATRGKTVDGFCVIVVAKNDTNALIIANKVIKDNGFRCKQVTASALVLGYSLHINEGYFNTVTFDSNQSYFTVFKCPYCIVDVRGLKLESFLSE